MSAASGASIAEAGGVVVNPGAAAGKHFHPKGKLPSKFTIELRKGVSDTLPFEDKRDFDEAKKGFIAEPPYKKIMADAGHVAWDMASYQWLLQGKDFDSIHPSLQRQAILNMAFGLYEVVPDKIYQVRDYDPANISFIKGDSGRVFSWTAITWIWISSRFNGGIAKDLSTELGVMDYGVSYRLFGSTASETVAHRDEKSRTNILEIYAGGFGVDNVDFTGSALGVVGYRTTLFGVPSSVQAGYKALNIDVDSGGAVAANVTLNGLFVGLTGYW